MNEVSKFNAATCRLITPQVLESLAELASDLGLKLKSGGGMYSENEWTLKLKFNTVDESGNTQTRAQQDWPLYCDMYDMKPEWLGLTLSAGHKIVGLNPKAPKNCVVLEKGGKGFKCSAEAVKRDRAILELDPRIKAIASAKVGAGGF